LIALLFPGLPGLIIYYLLDRLAEWPIILAWPVLAFACVLLIDALRNALFGPEGLSWLKAGLVCLASVFVVPALTFALCTVFSGDMRMSLKDGLWLLPMALMTPFGLISPAYAFATESRRELEWANLPIN
jgi:hypothetical protein